MGGWRYLPNENVLGSVARLPQRKLLHGVAHPVGGATQDPLNYLSLWRAAVERLDPVWVSEHLSFNRVSRGSRIEDAGFLLPPQQTSGQRCTGGAETFGGSRRTSIGRSPSRRA